MEVAKDFMPGIIDVIKPKKKDPSTMCEFTIKGDSEFVLDSVEMIFRNS